MTSFRRQVLCAALLLAGSSALAQGGAPAAASRPALPVVPAASPEERLRISSEGVQYGREALRTTASALDAARRSSDVVKLNCLNEKLTQVKGLVRLSEQASAALKDALARNDGTAAERAYAKGVLARDRVAVLQQEASACIGQLAFRTDESLAVEVVEPDDLFGGDPTQLLPPPPLTVRPPPASPDGARR